MENVKKSNGNLPWKLVWDLDTKDVLFCKKIEGDFETINEMYESISKFGVLRKINELGLNYDPDISEENWYEKDCDELVG